MADDNDPEAPLMLLSTKPSVYADSGSRLEALATLPRVAVPDLSETTNLIGQSNETRPNLCCQVTLTSIAILITIASLIALVLCVVYIYKPAMSHYHRTNCKVDQCQTRQVVCCSRHEATRTCDVNNYSFVTFTLKLDGQAIVKNETYYCDGPKGNYNWAYPNMCFDPELTTRPCFYDDRNVNGTLHLSNAWQSMPLNAIAGIVAFSILASVFIIYLVVSWIKYYQCRKRDDVGVGNL